MDEPSDRRGAIQGSLFVVAMPMEELPVDVAILPTQRGGHDVVDLRQVLRREEQSTEGALPLLPAEQRRQACCTGPESREPTRSFVINRLLSVSKCTQVPNVVAVNRAHLLQRGRDPLHLAPRTTRLHQQRACTAPCLLQLLSWGSASKLPRRFTGLLITMASPVSSDPLD
jgi:hypothetical protein